MDEKINKLEMSIEQAVEEIRKKHPKCHVCPDAQTMDYAGKVEQEGIYFYTCERGHIQRYGWNIVDIIKKQT